MYTSYYDLMARVKTGGADNAFDRLKGIQSWYENVQRSAQEAGVGDTVSHERFYRVYYSELGIGMQGWNTSGGVGLDAEFLESAAMYAAVPFGFFGIGSATTGVLSVSPSMPSSLDFWKIENMMFCGVKYDLTMTAHGIRIDAVRGNTTGLSVRVALPLSAGKTVYVDGIPTDYTVEDGRAVLTVPMKATQIIIQ